MPLAAQNLIGCDWTRNRGLKNARSAKDYLHRRAFKQSKADKKRKAILVGEADLRRVVQGEWDEADILEMIDEVLARPVDRTILGLG